MKGASSVQRLGLTNHHVDILWFQATKKFSSQTDPFKVHKNSPKNFKPILGNHLEQESTKLLVNFKGTTICALRSLTQSSLGLLVFELPHGTTCQTCQLYH